MNDQQNKAFDFALESIKQVLTLASGILALTVTFRKDIATKAPPGTEHWLEASWIALLASAVLGVLCIGSLTGSLGQSNHPSIYRLGTRVLAGIQGLAFIAGLACVVVFGVKAL